MGNSEVTERFIVSEELIRRLIRLMKWFGYVSKELENLLFDKDRTMYDVHERFLISTYESDKAIIKEISEVLAGGIFPISDTLMYAITDNKVIRDIAYRKLTQSEKDRAIMNCWEYLEYLKRTKKGQSLRMHEKKRFSKLIQIINFPVMSRKVEEDYFVWYLEEAADKITGFC